MLSTWPRRIAVVFALLLAICSVWVWYELRMNTVAAKIRRMQEQRRKIDAMEDGPPRHSSQHELEIRRRLRSLSANGTVYIVPGANR
jgi:hypothetical protein